MKKLLFSFLSFLLITGVAIGQEDPAKALKKATRAMGSYNLDPSNNEAKLQEAKEMIDIATSDATVSGSARAWQTKGDIYSAYLQKDMGQLVVNPQHMPEHGNKGIAAVEAYGMALEKAVKKFETKDAVKGLSEAGKNMNFVGNAYIGAQKYAEAYPALNAAMQAHTLVTEKGADPVVEDVNNQKYLIAFCASAAGADDVANGFFKELYEAGFEEPGVYSRYFNALTAEGNMDEALKVLEAGRAKFPNDTEILFAEINYYIQKEQYDVLEGKLKQAVDAEPNNASIRSALGNVYMNLYDGEFKANGETEKATGYFDNALEYFNQAIGINASQIDALYSIGSLYFNKAVVLLQKQSNLGMSKEDQKTYEVYTKKTKELFEQALPYFKKSEQIEPNDKSTLTALMEIYARQNDYELSGEFKKRIETVNGGGSVESYFKGK